MKKVKIFSGNWTETDARTSSDIFVFGDNLKRFGTGGQAVIRNLSNTIGLVTKKEPSNFTSSFFTDLEYQQNCKLILKDILDIKSEQVSGEQLVFSSGGYGTGLSKMPEKSPRTFAKLNELLLNFFHYDNLTGQIKTKLPSSHDINGGTYLSLGDISKPSSNVEFNQFSLENEVYNVYDQIKFEHKCSFIHANSFSTGDIVLFFESGKEYLVCRVICDSMPISDVQDPDRFEGYSVSNIHGYITFFEFISTLDEKSGRMEYNKRFFNFGNSKMLEPKPVGKDLSIEVRVENLEKKIDHLFEFLKSKLG
jgi:hypothetical protein